MIYTPSNLVQNVFGEWVDPNERHVAPCIQIPITPAIRAADAARQPRTVSSDWPLKAMLCASPVQAPKPKSPKKQPPAPEPAESEGPRRCACGRALAKANQRQTCYLCRWHKKCRGERLARRVACDTPGCHRLLRYGRTSGLCKKCGNKLRHPEHKRRWRAKKKAQQ